MGAERRRITFRYEFGQAVYLQGSAAPYTVQGQRYTALREPKSEQREYLLQGATNDLGNELPPFWIYEHHIYINPP